MEIIIKIVREDSMFCTVLAGVFVFILSQCLLEFVIIPYLKYRELKAKIEFTLTMYAKYYSNPLYYDEEKLNEITVNNYRNASEEVRKMAAEVAGYIGNCSFFVSKEKLKDVKSYLIYISNSFFKDDVEERLSKENKQMEKKIKELLKIK